VTQNSLGIIETHSYAWALKVLQNLPETRSINFIKIETSGDSIVSVFFEGELASIKKMIDINSEVLKKENQYITSMIIPKPHIDLIKYLKEK
jgi:microcompartment protein CcmL/EutN